MLLWSVSRGMFVINVFHTFLFLSLHNIDINIYGTLHDHHDFGPINQIRKIIYKNEQDFLLKKLIKNQRFRRDCEKVVFIFST